MYIYTYMYQHKKKSCTFKIKLEVTSPFLQIP